MGEFISTALVFILILFSIASISSKRSLLHFTGTNFAPCPSINTLYSGKYGVFTIISSFSDSIIALKIIFKDAAAPQVIKIFFSV